MVESERKPQEFLTFTSGENTAQIPLQGAYIPKDIINTLAALGIKQQSTETYKIINKLAPNSRISTGQDNRVRHSLTQEDLTNILKHSIQKHESARNKPVKSYALPDTKTIEISGISDSIWETCKGLLDKLWAARSQTESGEIQITPIPFEEVRKFFPDNTSQLTIFRVFQILNSGLIPSGWSIMRAGKGRRKPLDAPWFLRGPDDNGVQNKPQLKPKQNTYDISINEQKKRVALQQFDPLAFGTSLLHQSLSNLTNPDAKEVFTNDPAQLMSNFLPTEIKLQDIIGNKTPQEYFQERIQEAINSMAGKTYQELPEKQQPIVPLWNTLKKQSGQHPKMVILEHFSMPNKDTS